MRNISSIKYGMVRQSPEKHSPLLHAAAYAGQMNMLLSTLFTERKRINQALP